MEAGGSRLEACRGDASRVSVRRGRGLPGVTGACFSVRISKDKVNDD